MKALKSPLAHRVLRAGIRIQPGVPFDFEGRTYRPVIVPKADDRAPLRSLAAALSDVLHALLRRR